MRRRSIAAGLVATALVAGAVYLAGTGGGPKPCHGHHCFTTPPPSPTSTSSPTSSPSSSPSPSSSAAACVGVQLYPPGGFTNAAIGAKASGTTFCLHPGTYAVPSSVLLKSNDVVIGPGAVLDFTAATISASNGASYAIYGYVGAQDGAKVSGVEIENAHKVDSNGIYTAWALKAGANWIVDDVDIHGSDKGYFTGPGSVIENSHIHDNFVFGINGPAGTIGPNNDVSYNGGHPDTGGSMGGSKAVQDGNISWVGNYVHNNRGPGIWFDGHRGDAIVTGNRIENNLGPGVDYEISWHGTQLASGNTFKGNATNYLGTTCFHAGQVQVQNSEGVQILDNVIDSSSGVNALCVIDTYRPSNVYPASPENVEPFLASGNDVTLAGPALYGEAGQQATSSCCPAHTVAGVSFQANTYHEASSTEIHWEWISSTGRTLASWQALGQG